MKKIAVMLCAVIFASLMLFRSCAGFRNLSYTTLGGFADNTKPTEYVRGLFADDVFHG